MKEDSFHYSPVGQRPSEPRQADFGEFEATDLYCPKCGRAVPINKFLLLVLPDGDRYEYRCRVCGTPVGKKTDKA